MVGRDANGAMREEEREDMTGSWPCTKLSWQSRTSHMLAPTVVLLLLFCNQLFNNSNARVGVGERG